MVLRRKVGRTNHLTINRRQLRGLQEWIGQFHPYRGDERETLEDYIDHLTRHGGNAMKSSCSPITTSGTNRRGKRWTPGPAASLI